MAGRSIFGRFFGSAISNATGVAVGGSVQNTLNPLTQALANETWALHPDVPVDPILLAQGVAQRQLDRTASKAEAAMSGIDDDAFDRIVEVFDTGPGLAQAYELRRRNLLSDGDFKTALRREGIEDKWIDPLAKLVRDLLTPSELANAVVQGHRSLDAAADDAELWGLTRPDFQTMVDNTGLPPGPETLMAWWRRGIIDEGELEQGIREGHTKVKYIPKYEASRNPVLSHITYVGLRLRGWLTKAESDAGGLLTGYTPEQMELEFLNRGRPATTHQVHIGYSRGGRLQGVAADERETFRRAVLQSDIRPEYEPILWAQRYTYPSAFVLRSLVQGGEITEADAHEVLLFSGWEPTLAAKVSAAWAKPATGTTVNPRVKRAQDQVVNAAHRSYLDGEIDRARALDAIDNIVGGAAIAGQVVDLWEQENAVLVKPLTASQIKKAYSRNEFTIDEAVRRLELQQWKADDADTFLKS